MKAFRFLRTQKVPTKPRTRINKHINFSKPIQRHLSTDPTIIKTEIISSIDYTKNITIPKDCDAENINVYVNSIKPLLCVKRDKKDLGFEDDIKRNFHIKINFEGKNVLTKQDQHIEKYEFSTMENILYFSFFASPIVLIPLISVQIINYII